MKSIELFAGAGGLGIGVSKAGFTAVDIVERDKWCCNTIMRNRALAASPIASWPEVRRSDIRKLSFQQFEDQVALVTGGPPCQPFSMGGLHKAHGDERDMWSEAVRVVREVRPKAFLFENVKGLTRATFEAYVSYIQLQLSYPDITIRHEETWFDHRSRLERHHTACGTESLKYNVLPPRVLNAADYGVPQKRHRVFFVGFRSDVDAMWSWPQQTHSRESLLWDQFRSGSYWDRHELLARDGAFDHRSTIAAAKLREMPVTKAWVTARDAINDLPVPHSDFSSFDDHRHQPGARAYPGHTGSWLDEPAKTLKAGVHGVPGGENMLRRSDGSVRYFTIRESARLQAFPDSYRFDGSWTEVMRQLGNAVPVDLAEVVAQSIKGCLEVEARDQRNLKWQRSTTH
ncbi:DNA (cytosine-5)-methyltransferase 1 [Porphyrobacter sp. MBR-155]|jgi:DNA (cytosine-5)-methyltransferase 1|uniref:DNA cytosine methyltransferase n=1 Tax=Porphyrobacter sp. MBR-155 TaxID=3156464 RepID=UPI003390D5DB